MHRGSSGGDDRSGAAYDGDGLGFRDADADRERGAGARPRGTAEQNLPYFDKVNQATIAAKPAAQGRDFIDALVAAGFTKSDMQVTPDMTTIGLKAASIQFSVRFGAGCVIGQYGPDSGGYTSLTSPTLATGGCLIGQTRPIDW
ncbi:DUF6993 domain-containing protein [Leifsonia sp. P73]|uniref:DUF6993 domain-containing protein n=1 Tax=Leifsonia sp. P73 TaxID=3423959 RepID=UPI003DA3F290